MSIPNTRRPVLLFTKTFEHPSRLSEGGLRNKRGEGREREREGKGKGKRREGGRKKRRRKKGERRYNMKACNIGGAGVLQLLSLVPCP